MHYTAVTSSAEHFTKDGYVLRSHRGGGGVGEDVKPKNMMVVITMYNEPASQLFGTMSKVAKNIDFLNAEWQRQVQMTLLSLSPSPSHPLTLTLTL